MNDFHYLALSTGLSWVMLLTASLMRVRAWTWPESSWHSAIGTTFPSRRPPPAERTAPPATCSRTSCCSRRSLPPRASRGWRELVTLGAAIFFWSRVVYFGVYLAGIRWLRTAIRGVSVVGLALIAARVFSR